MKKAARILFYIALAIVICCGAFFGVCEFLPDRSVVSESLDKILMITGLASLLYVIVYYIFTHKTGKEKNKMRR